MNLKDHDLLKSEQITIFSDSEINPLYSNQNDGQSVRRTEPLPDHSLSHIGMKVCKLGRHVSQGRQAVGVEILVLK